MFLRGGRKLGLGGGKEGVGGRGRGGRLGEGKLRPLGLRL